MHVTGLGPRRKLLEEGSNKGDLSAFANVYVSKLGMRLDIMNYV